MFCLCKCNEAISTMNVVTASTTFVLGVCVCLCVCSAICIEVCHDYK